jgi:hypothetical protein
MTERSARSVTNTFAPAMKGLVVASPRPEAPPVMKTIFSVKRDRDIELSFPPKKKNRV